MDSISRITDQSAVNECSYTTLPDHHTLPEDSFSISSSVNGFKPLKSFAYVFSVVLFICSTVLVLVGDHQRSEILSSILPPTTKIIPSSVVVVSSRGVSEGVSEKSNANNLLAVSNPFPWTNNMLSWQRTSFHFQPQRNWMNDPNGNFLLCL